MELSKVYDPKAAEDRIYKLWEKSGFFNPDKLPGPRKKAYTIVIPLPNITGSLHMGHALNATIQDILIRWKRMQGFKTLWLPGTDHAGIATQNVVEKELKKEGLTRFDLGREKFLERIWQWKAKYGSIILEQLKKLGSSLDWSRTKFTMDKDYSLAVREAFLHYYKKGWIYRARKTVFWCPRCKTSISDLELSHKEEKTSLYYIKYGPITIATVRPETKFGDTAVAVNPKDKRYKRYVGKTIEIDSLDVKGTLDEPKKTKVKMQVIADDAVDPNFGTGAIKVTPAHDITDYEIAQRKGLPIIQVIDEDGRMNKKAGKYAGMKVAEARSKIAQDLKAVGLMVKEEPYKHRIAFCYRCDSMVEPLPSDQWFLKMGELAEMAKKAVKKGKVSIVPKNFEKLYFNWLDNIRDWCISRQLWWGHKIPIEGEADVLDTWFSSALWPFATLGWPKKTKDLKNFYPTDVLSTDRGIINLWVARMIFSGMEFMQREPFKDVYIHATVLTREGKRMSKSLGTGVDPLELVEKYGADATRFGVAWQIMASQDIRFVEDNIVMGRKFCNKIWNASRFVMQQIGNPKFQNLNPKQILNSKFQTAADKKILKSLNQTTKIVNHDLQNFRFGQAARKLSDFFWHDFCDIYIEKSKSEILNPKSETEKVLFYVLLNSLKLLHPFMPFITEEIYQKLAIKNKKKCLMVESWPK